MSFTATALKYFDEEVPEGMTQRIDAVACFSPLSTFPLWRLRLRVLTWRGMINKRAHGSIWASCNGLPGYGPVPGEGKKLWP